MYIKYGKWRLSSVNYGRMFLLYLVGYPVQQNSFDIWIIFQDSQSEKLYFYQQKNFLSSGGGIQIGHLLILRSTLPKDGFSWPRVPFCGRDFTSPILTVRWTSTLCTTGLPVSNWRQLYLFQFLTSGFPHLNCKISTCSWHICLEFMMVIGPRDTRFL